VVQIGTNHGTVNGKEKSGFLNIVVLGNQGNLNNIWRGKNNYMLAIYMHYHTKILLCDNIE